MYNYNNKNSSTVKMKMVVCSTTTPPPPTKEGSTKSANIREAENVDAEKFAPLRKFYGGTTTVTGPFLVGVIERRNTKR